MVFNLFSSAVTLLYLSDNEASKLVLIGVLMKLEVDSWKLFKWVGMNRKSAAAAGSPSPKAGEQKKDAVPEEDAKSALHRVTVEADTFAGTYVSVALLLAVLVYAAYSLAMDRHRGYYSWFVASLYGVASALGFAAMTPQLYINYKLKSVEFMPWRTLVYRAVNTFVDDLFSLIIDMPIGHRLSCLRDDLIFFVFLYQRHIYPPDKKNRAGGDHGRGGGGGGVNGFRVEEES